MEHVRDAPRPVLNGFIGERVVQRSMNADAGRGVSAAFTTETRLSDD